MKRMKHPDHGFHHAYTDQEETALRERGWVEDDGEDLRRKLAALAPPTIPEPVPPPKRGPGRPRKQESA